MSLKCKVLKVFTVMFLFTLFVWVNLLIFINYIHGKRITTSDIVSGKKQTLPAILICRKTAFSEHAKDVSSLQGYLESTVNLDYIKSTTIDSKFEPHHSNSTKFKTEHIYSYSRGHCDVFKYIEQVKNQYPNKKYLKFIEQIVINSFMIYSTLK